MKLFNRYFLLAVASCCIFTACSNNDDYVSGSAANSGENIYFAASNESSPVLATDENTFSITVERSNGTAAESIPLIVATPHDSIFTVPATVDFASGETSKTITITASAKMRMFKTYALSLAIPEAYTHQYAETEVYPRMELSVLKEDYQPYANGTYTCGFFGDSWEAELEYSPILNLYRFSGCWMPGYDVTFTWDGGASITVNGGEAITTGYVHSRYGMVSATPIKDECGYDTDSKLFTFGYTWTVSAGPFGDYADYFEITEMH